QKPGLINLIASVDGLKETPEPKHLVMNAHLDVFPAAAGQRTDRTGDTIYGRGAVDMKGGAGAFMMALATLKQHRDAFAGRVTLILVCDEETFGPHGSLAVVAEHPELFGDYLLSSEPSSVGVVRYGERGHIWSKVTFTGAAGHSAYPGTDESPIERAAKFITALKEKI